MPGEEDPLAVSALQYSGFSQRQDGSLLVRSMSEDAHIIQFHGVPADIALRPYLEFGDGKVERGDFRKLLLDISFKVRPSHVFPAPDGIAGDVGVVRHQPGHPRQILLGIGAHEGTDCRLKRAVVRRGADSWGNPADTSNGQIDDEANQYGHSHDDSPVGFTRETGGKIVWLEVETTGPIETCQWLHACRGCHAGHDDHGHIIFSPSAQRLLDQVVAGLLGIAVGLGEDRSNGGVL